MAQHEGRALVLDVSDYRETSSLVRVLTENEGRISLVGRGLRHGKNGGTGVIQPFNQVRLHYYLKEGATMGNLASAELERVTAAPRNSLSAYAVISYWFELLRETAQPREASTPVFELTIGVLDQQESAPGLSLNYLEALTKLCGYLGFGLSWSHCVGCGRPTPLPEQLSLTRGGVICGGCLRSGEAGVVLKPGEARLISRLGNGEAGDCEDFPVGIMLNLLGLMDRYLALHLGHTSKTFGFLRSAIGELG